MKPPQAHDSRERGLGASRNTLFWLAVAISFPFITMYLSQSLLWLSSLAASTFAASSYPNVSTKLQGILDDAYQGPLYTYPTSLTQGIVPVRARIAQNRLQDLLLLERHSLSQRLLASCSGLLRHLCWVCQHRGRCLAREWNTARWT